MATEQVFVDKRVLYRIVLDYISRRFFHNDFNLAVTNKSAELEEHILQRTKYHTIDLTKTRGSGEVKCPRCRNRISPDDETENAYTLLEAIMKGHSLENVVLRCNRCQTLICLTGFQLLNEIG